MVKYLILDPLGMKNSGFNYTSDVLARMAVGYYFGQPAPFLNVGWDMPSGGMYSTTEDFTHLMKLFFRTTTPAGGKQVLDGN